MLMLLSSVDELFDMFFPFLDKCILLARVESFYIILVFLFLVLTVKNVVSTF